MGLGVVGVGVAGWACLSSGAALQGLTPGVLGEMGVVGSTLKQTNIVRLDRVRGLRLHSHQYVFVLKRITSAMFMPSVHATLVFSYQ